MVKATPSWQAVSGGEGPKERSRWVVDSKLPGVRRPLLECLETVPVELLQKTLASTWGMLLLSLHVNAAMWSPSLTHLGCCLAGWGQGPAPELLDDCDDSYRRHEHDTALRPPALAILCLSRRRQRPVWPILVLLI